MLDQGVVSLGNFAINIFLARHLARLGRLAEYGEFGLLFDLMLFLNGIHAALIVYPLTIRSAAADQAVVRRFMSICLTLTLAAAPIVGGIVGFTAALLHHDPHLGIWCALALITWQAQETTRKTLMAELRFRAAIAGDAISYLGQFTCVMILAWTDALSLRSTYQAMAATSFVALALQAWQVGVVKVGFAHVAAFAREAWTLGRWVLWSNLSNIFTGTLYTANFMFWAGKEAVGVAAAINNLLRVANPLLIVVGSMIAPHAARARAHGVRAAMAVSLRFCTLGAFLLLPYLAALMLAPRAALRLAYGENAAYLAFSYVLIVIAAQNAVSYFAAAGATFLNAVERSRAAFLAQAFYALAMVCIGMPLTAWFHYPGAAAGTLIAAIAQWTIVAVAIRALLGEERSTRSSMCERTGTPALRYEAAA